jgi:uncharacterized protein YwqG
MDKTGVEAALRKAGLTQLIPALDTLVQPTLRLHTTLTADDKLAAGTSKLGGSPDLPSNISWPELHGTPHSFIAQIHLNDLQAFSFTHALPAQGMLWFFYDAQQQTFGEDPQDAAGWHIFYHPSDQQLTRTAAPAKLPSNARFPAATITFAPELTLAQQPQLELPDLQWSDDDQAKYDPIFSQFYDEAGKDAPRHQLLGHPYTIQDDMRVQCELLSNGKTLDDPQADDYAKTANQWHLLLQIDSDDSLHMQWGSAGLLYYWLKQSAPDTHQFDPNWLVLQSE